MIGLKRLMKLAAKPNSVEILRAVVFDGRSAIVATGEGWVVGVPCPQPQLVAPVVVPIRTLQIHMNKGADLVVEPDQLTNSRGMVTALNVGLGRREGLRLPDYAQLLQLMPPEPAGVPLAFPVGLDELDRTLVAAGKRDTRTMLNGVLFDLAHGALVGCDGHRLHVFRGHLPAVKPEQGLAMAVPRDPLAWMLASVDTHMTVQVWRAHVPHTDWGPDKTPELLLSTADTFVWVRSPLHGVYPDWERVLAPEAMRPVRAQLCPVQLADAAIAASHVEALKGAKFAVVRLDLKAGHLRAGDDVLPLGVVLESAAPQWEPVAMGSFAAAVNPAYLQDLADCVTAGAWWSLDPATPHTQPVMAVEGPFVGVVMPARDGAWLPGPNEPKALPTKAAAELAEGSDDTEPVPEPCPAAVASVAAQLLGHVQALAREAKPKKPARLARKLEPVAV